MGVFWREGYNDTSIADLVEATRVARYGWYTEFGNKDAIFVAALAFYRDFLNRKQLEKLRAPDADLRAIESHLRVNLGIAYRGPLKRCFACASALERGRVDTQVAGVVEVTMADVRATFRNAMENAARAGQVRNLPVEILVEFTLNSMRHLLTLVSSGTSRKEIESCIETTFALLKP